MMLPLVKSLTPRFQIECAGLESGSARFLKSLAVTADLLWLRVSAGLRECAAVISQRQRQAILHAIYAHEVLQSESLVDLYRNSPPRTC